MTGSSQWLRLLTHKVAIHGVILTYTLFASRVYRLVDNPLAQPLVLGALCGVCLLYSLAALLERRWVYVLIVISYLSLLVFEMYYFSVSRGVPIQLNALFQYVPPICFIVFAMVIEDGLGSYILMTVKRYSLIYACVYVVTTVTFLSQILPKEYLVPIIASDIERGDRLWAASTILAFGWFSCLVHIQKRPTLRVCLASIVFVSAIILTLSRVYISFVFFISLAWVARIGVMSLRRISLAILWTVAIAFVLGFVDPFWNPFRYFSNDSSGAFRLEEYYLILDILRDSPLFGAGIATSQIDIGEFTGNPFFAAGDLGILGTWFDFGLLGLLAFFIGSHIVCMPRPEIKGQLGIPMFLTGCLLTATGCISQTIFYQPGSLFFGLSLAFWIRSFNGMTLLKTG